MHVSIEEICGASDQTMQALVKLCSTRVNNEGSGDICLAPECAYSYSVCPEESSVAPEQTMQGLEKVVTCTYVYTGLAPEQTLQPPQ